MRFRLIAGIWPLLVSNMLALAIAGLCMSTLSAMRAFVGGESLWSKAQRDAVAHLHEYALGGDPDEYKQFRVNLAVSDGTAGPASRSKNRTRISALPMMDFWRAATTPRTLPK